nr:MAG TPA: hypothetical protein [Bacteriophage sp.]
MLSISDLFMTILSPSVGTWLYFNDCCYNCKLFFVTISAII